MKHEGYTKGPWKVLDGAIVSDKLNVFGNWIIAGLDRPRTDEDEDNLELLADAPRLYEENQRLIKANAGLLRGCKIAEQILLTLDCEGTGDLGDRALIIVRKAIAQTKGGE